MTEALRMVASRDLLGYEAIEIRSPYQIQQLTKLKIVRRINCHTTVYYTGIIPEAKKDEYIRKATADDCFEICAKDGLIPRTLFKGLVSDVAIKAVRDIYYLEVEGVSHTAKMDVKLKNRSFQNKDGKFKKLLDEVVSGYSGCDIKDNASNGALLDKFILQRNETDWQFVKRLASRFNAFLIPYDLVEQPKLWFGFPDEDAGEIKLPDNLQYSIGKNLKSYAELFENDFASVTDTDFVYFVIKSGQYYPLGFEVIFKGIKLIVAQSIAELTGGSLIYEYLLCPKEGLNQKPFRNHQILGASLGGKVIDRDGDKIRAHLDIDPKQDKDTAWWFPYATFYTAEGNTGFYCPPQLGDQIRVYFPTVKEEEGFAMDSIRKDKDRCRKTQNPEVKHFGTSHGKELKMADQEFSITAKDQQEGQIVIRFDAQKGVEIRSDNEINLKTKKTLAIDIEKQTSIKAGDEIQLVCGSSSIQMDGAIHIGAPKTRVGPG
jgi:hypothetical protein